MHRPLAAVYFLNSLLARLVGNTGVADMSAASRSMHQSLLRRLRKAEAQLARWNRHEARHSTYFATGLNGARAVERRQRQIAHGEAGGISHIHAGATLREANGLVRV